MNKINKNISIENADISFLNFGGKEQKFNPAGRRNFCVFLENDVSKQLEEDGWNVRYLDSLEEDEAPKPYLQVTVSFNNKPPKVVLVNSISRRQTLLDEDSVNMLDWAEIENADIVLQPYNWDVNGKQGVKAYLKAGYFTITEDEFASKYETPDID